MRRRPGSIKPDRRQPPYQPGRAARRSTNVRPTSRRGTPGVGSAPTIVRRPRRHHTRHAARRPVGVPPCPRAPPATGAHTLAAHDPQRRREAASIAARARLDRMTEAQRADMTADARRALHQRDLATVDAEARQLGQYPLDDDTRLFRAGLLRAVRAHRASLAASRAARTRHQAAAAQAPAHHEARAEVVR